MTGGGEEVRRCWRGRRGCEVGVAGNGHGIRKAYGGAMLPTELGPSPGKDLIIP